MTKLSVLAAGLLLALAQPMQAQVPLLDVRLGVQTAAPTGPLANGFKSGVGVYARVGTPAAPISLMGAVTWTRFTPEANAANDYDLMTVQFGPHLSLIPGVDVGLEGAYLTKVEKLGFAPVVSIGIINFEATLSYTTTLSGPTTSWFALGVGLKF